MSHANTLDAPDDGPAPEAPAPVLPATGGALWASVADGFYVGSDAGSFLGYVDRQPDGRWRAFDAVSRVIGDFPDHHAAIAATTEAMTGEAAGCACESAA